MISEVRPPRLVVLALALVFAASAARAQGAGFEVAGWSGGPIQLGEGRLRCAVQREYDGVFLTVVIGGGSEALVLIGDPALADADAAPMAASIRVGDQFENDTSAEVQENVALLSVTPPGAFLDAFGRGSALAVDLDGRSYDFPLDGTMAAVEQARACVAALAAVAEPAARRLLLGSLVPGADAERFGAIAISPGTALVGTAWNQASREAAEADSLEACGQADCEVLVWFGNACGAVAVGLDGSIGSDWGNSLPEAQEKARAICETESGGACAIVEGQCTD